MAISSGCWFFFFFFFWGGGGAVLRWWPPSAMWAGPFIFYCHQQGWLNNSIFSNLGLCAACWAHFMCHHELWPTAVGQPFYFLNSSWGLTGGKYYRKTTIPIFRHVFQNFAIPGCFPNIIFYCSHFSSLSSGWFVIAVCGSISVRKIDRHLESL